jgi:hypothetical protein
VYFGASLGTSAAIAVAAMANSKRCNAVIPTMSLIL